MYWESLCAQRMENDFYMPGNRQGKVGFHPLRAGSFADELVRRVIAEEGGNPGGIRGCGDACDGQQHFAGEAPVDDKTYLT